MVDHQVNRHQGVDALGVSSQASDRGAHGSQIDDSRDAGEILHDHPRRAKRQTRPVLRFRLPIGQIDHILAGDLLLITLAQERFQHDPQGERQPAQLDQAIFL
jgi:hypothetical protein